MSERSRTAALIDDPSRGVGAVHADRLARRGHDLGRVARDPALRTKTRDGMIVDGTLQEKVESGGMPGQAHRQPRPRQAPLAVAAPAALSNRTLTEALGRRFGLIDPPVLQSGDATRPGVVFANLAAKSPLPSPSRDVPREDSFSIQVALKPVRSAEFWTKSRHVGPTGIPIGGTFLFDLADNPRVMMHDSFDFVRFNISRKSMDELAYRNGLRRPDDLGQCDFGTVDHVMLGLATTLHAAFRLPQQASALFLDHLAHAFHMHMLTAYGRLTDSTKRAARGLNPKQLRESCEAMMESPGPTLTIDALAARCRMSSRHFARSFLQSTGLPPHRWLIRARVERAAHMLANSYTSIADIAVACGFNDQSHLTRTFLRIQGRTPAEWRRLMRR